MRSQLKSCSIGRGGRRVGLRYITLVCLDRTEVSRSGYRRWSSQGIMLYGNLPASAYPPMRSVGHGRLRPQRERQRGPVDVDVLQIFGRAGGRS